MQILSGRAFLIIAIGTALAVMTFPAQARKAFCSTTFEGYYPEKKLRTVSPVIDIPETWTSGWLQQVYGAMFDARIVADPELKAVVGRRQHEKQGTQVPLHLCYEEEHPATFAHSRHTETRDVHGDIEFLEFRRFVAAGDEWLQGTYYMGCKAKTTHRTIYGTLKKFNAGTDAPLFRATYPGDPAYKALSNNFRAAALTRVQVDPANSQEAIHENPRCVVVSSPALFHKDQSAGDIVGLATDSVAPASEPRAPAAPKKPTGGITLSTPAGPTPDQREAQRLKEQREAAVEKEKQRLGAHREAEIRRLEALRERSDAASPKCTEKSIKVDGHSAQNVNSLLFTGWKTRAEALAQARSGGLGRRCMMMTGNSALGSETEKCSQNQHGVWECTVEATCATPQKICAGAQ